MPRITVVQALPKGDRGELAVEIMTETGVDAIVPWAASRCITQWKGERGLKALAKWQATAREAGKQSRRTRFPEVADAMSTKQVAALLAGADFAAVLHEDRDHPSGALADAQLPTEGEIVLIVGPEGACRPRSWRSSRRRARSHTVWAAACSVPPRPVRRPPRSSSAARAAGARGRPPASPSPPVRRTAASRRSRARRGWWGGGRASWPRPRNGAPPPAC